MRYVYALTATLTLVAALSWAQHVYAQQAWASMCVTSGGNCDLMEAATLDSPCACPTMDGPMKGFSL